MNFETNSLAAPSLAPKAPRSLPPMTCNLCLLAPRSARASDSLEKRGTVCCTNMAPCSWREILGFCIRCQCVRTCADMSLIMIPLTEVCHKEFGFGQREVWPLPLASGELSTADLTRMSLLGQRLASPMFQDRNWSCQNDRTCDLGVGDHVISVYLEAKFKHLRSQ